MFSNAVGFEISILTTVSLFQLSGLKSLRSLSPSSRPLLGASLGTGNILRKWFRPIESDWMDMHEDEYILIYIYTDMYDMNMNR